MALNFISLAIDAVIIYKINNPVNYVGVTQDGLEVKALKMYGFYIISFLSVLYLTSILLDIIRSVQQNKNKQV